MLIAVAGNPQPEIAKPIKSNKMVDNLGTEFKWDAEYIDGVHAGGSLRIHNLVLAANYLQMDPLLDLGCAKIAAILKGKTPAQVRAEFGIREPTPEEEAQIRKDNAWIFTMRPAGPSIPAATPAAPAAPAAVPVDAEMGDAA